LVFGARAAAAMIEERREFKPPSPCKVPNTHPGHALPRHESMVSEAKPARVSPQACVEDVRSLLWHDVGIIRNGRETCNALRRLNSLLPVCESGSSSKLHEARNILEVGRIITQCALARQESRGAHYRSDFPLKDESAPAKHSFASSDAAVFFA
jgi:L-aspartate oxidase